MNKQKEQTLQRRNIIAGLGIAAAGAAAVMPAHAQQPQAFTPTRHDLDAWLDELPGRHRIFIDSSSTSGGSDATRYAFNLYNAQSNAYAGSDADLAMIVCFRHGSTAYGYNNLIWEKYGEHLARLMQSQNQTPTTNPLNPARGGITIDALAARGTHFAICETATRLITSQVANAAGANANEVYEEVKANGIPNSHFVSAGVMAVTRSQEYGYSLLSAG